MRVTADNKDPTPYRSGAKLHPTEEHEEKLDAQYPYAKALSIVRYLADCTRPDISHVVGILARSMSKPTLRHCQSLKHLARYLKGTSDYGLQYKHATGQTPLQLQAYSDADFAGCQPTRRSTYGNLIYLNGNCSTTRAAGLIIIYDKAREH